MFKKMLSHRGGMFPDGWKISSSGGEDFGMYSCRNKLSKMMALAQYNWKTKQTTTERPTTSSLLN
jgi:hypothetical protein